MPRNQAAQGQRSKIQTIVLAGGGSGGHIAPLLPLARVLKRKRPDLKLVYIGLKGEKLAGLSSELAAFDQVYRVSSGKFRRYAGQSLLSTLLDIKTFLLNAIDLFKLAGGTMSAYRLLQRLKPALVFSKGGYGALPVGLAAHWTKIPIITHDSDAVPGLANRLIGRYAKVHATGMPAEHYNYPKNSLHYVGVPLDERIQPVNSADQLKFKQGLKLPADSFVLLLAGGGLGSRTLNDKILAIAKELLSREPKLHIIHFAGDKLMSSVQKSYQAELEPDQLKRIKLLGFSDEFYRYTGAADVVIARAGASTLAELALQAKPSIIFPARFLSDAHQAKNVELLQANQAAIIMEDSQSSQELFSQIAKLIQNPQMRQTLAKNFSSLAMPNAANDLAELIIQNLE